MFFSRLPFFEERQLYIQSLLTDGRRINRNPGRGEDKGERQIDCDGEAANRSRRVLCQQSARTVNSAVQQRLLGDPIDAV